MLAIENVHFDNRNRHIYPKSELLEEVRLAKPDLPIGTEYDG